MIVSQLSLLLSVDKMNEEFLIIAITRPEFFHGEAERINEILKKKEAHFIHIRKPQATALEIEKLITAIDPQFYNRIKLHDQFELLEKYPLGGVHLNSRNTNYLQGNCSISNQYIH